MQKNQGHANNETTVPEQVLELMPRVRETEYQQDPN